MRCRHVRKMTSRYVDDELSLDEKKAFDSHIQSCAVCKETLEETRALHRLFVSARRFPAPYGFASRVMANLEERKGLRIRSLFSNKPFFLRAAQVAFALLVMTIGVISGNLLLEERTNPIGQTAQTAVQQTFSLDLFQPMPPDSIGGIYYTLMRPGYER
jgi:anti-sigma factor RsiW